MKEIAWQELLALFDASVRDNIIEKAMQHSATHVIVFENLLLDSSAFGARSACVAGPGCTFETPAAAEGKWLNDLPSQRQYPTAFAAVPA